MKTSVWKRWAVTAFAHATATLACLPVHSPAVAASAPAPAQARASDPVLPSRPGSPLRLEGPGPYHRLIVPLAWQAQSRRGAAITPGDLGDVRLFNARGESLPYAWDPIPDGQALDREIQRRALTVFRWDGPHSPPKQLSVASRAVTSRPLPASTVSPSWPVWVMDTKDPTDSDASAGGTTLQALQIQIQLHPEQAPGIFAMALETSADLQHWDTLNDSVALARLVQGDQTLVQDSIELMGRPLRYLRLRALPGSAVPQIDGAQLLASATAAQPPVWSWSDAILPARCDATWCEYKVPPQVALTQLRVLLSEPNTLLPLVVQIRPPQDNMRSPPPGSEDSPRHPHRPHLRERLREIRHQNRERGEHDAAAPPPAPDTPAWNTVTEAQVYWLQSAQRESRLELMSLPSVNAAWLRIGTPGRPASGWSRAAPRIQVATWQRSLVFLDQGPQPYRLDWADPTAAPVALPMSQLRPEVAYSPEMSPASLEATAPSISALPGEPDARAAHPAAHTAGPSAVAEGRAKGAHWPWAWLLWAALLLGVGVMAYLVRSVFSGRAATPDADPPSER